MFYVNVPYFNGEKYVDYYVDIFTLLRDWVFEAVRDSDLLEFLNVLMESTLRMDSDEADEFITQKLFASIDSVEFEAWFSLDGCPAVEMAMVTKKAS